MDVLEIMNTLETLTKEQYEIVKAHDEEFAKKYLCYQEWSNNWLNTNVYSEWEHDEFQLRMERGF